MNINYHKNLFEKQYEKLIQNFLIFDFSRAFFELRQFIAVILWIVLFALYSQF